MLNSGGNFGMRYLEGMGVFDANGLGLFPYDDRMLCYIMALYNSCVAKTYLSILSSTMAFVIGDMKRIPIRYDEEIQCAFTPIVENNIEIAQREWNSFEVSWDFDKHPLI